MQIINCSPSFLLERVFLVFLPFYMESQEPSSSAEHTSWLNCCFINLLLRQQQISCSISSIKSIYRCLVFVPSCHLNQLMSYMNENDSFMYMFIEQIHMHVFY